MKQKLDDVLETGVQNGRVPGVVAATVDKEGLTYLGSAGERIIGTGDVMTTDTVGAIASMTKAITGAAVMQLVEKGHLDLDAPAETYCAELSTPQVLEGCYPVAVEDMKRFVAPVVVLAVTFAVFAMSFARL